jgi:hypothetical protein
MPKDKSPLSNWKRNQLSRFDANIEKEIAAYDGNLWRDRKARLLACIVKKKSTRKTALNK